MLLNTKPVKMKEIVPASLPWWVCPPLYFLLFLLPFFLVTIIISEPYMFKLGQQINNITPENIMIGLLSIAMLTFGSSIFSFIRNKRKDPVTYDTASIERVLLFLGLLSAAANAIYFFPLLFHPGLIISFFSGNSHAMYEIRGTLGQIPGVTSFMTACMPFFSLYSFVTLRGSEYKLSPFIKNLFYLLFLFVFARAILGAERLALVIAIMAYLVPRVAFSWKASPVRFFAPFAGIFGVFALFSFGEYFRSWQHYKMHYDSFIEFISVRFLGYFSTAINTGSGVVTHYEPYGYPYYTADWVIKLFRIFGVKLDISINVVQDYLYRYATPEFNNPGGLYVPYMDYGIMGGALFFLIVGVFTGWLFMKFRQKDPIGILLFPCWFVGCLDLIRVVLWAGSGFTPIIILSIAAAFMLKKEQELRPYSFIRNKEKT